MSAETTVPDSAIHFVQGDTARARARWTCRSPVWLARLLRWEFWPSTALYAPLLPWFVWLAARHGGVTAFTAANPAMPHGGVVGESKWDILSRLPQDAVVPSAIIKPGPLQDRLNALLDAVARPGWGFPCVLKPDVGERGTGVRLVSDAAQAREYLNRHAEAVLAQAFDPGPFEAGVFYVRDPRERQGRIFSVTDKVFPVVVGDGRSTLRSLVLAHPRYRLQATTFLSRLGPAEHRMPRDGEQIRLAMAGNHCQGTMFRDGSHLITPQLTDAINHIASAYNGFHFGRLDVRYSSVADFRQGKHLRIVELNGVLSESTNIYDPSFSFLQAQRVLREQWRLAYVIGSTNHRRGTPISTMRQLLHLVTRHLSRPAHDHGSD